MSLETFGSAAACVTDAFAMVERRDVVGGLYWAFIAGQKMAGVSYLEAKRNAATFGLVPPYLQHPVGV